METLAQKALRLLSSVPKEDYITRTYTDNIGKCCAVGHYARLTSKNTDDYSLNNCYDDSDSESIKLRILSSQFIKNKYDMLHSDLSTVNNGPTINGYIEPEIKDRVIHLLTDMVTEVL